MNIIEQIKAEIERLKVEHQTPTFKGDEYEEGGVNGYQLALNKVLYFLDTLQEKSEKPINPVCEGLEEEIKRCIYEPFFDLNGVAIKGATDYISVEDVANLARHFYEFGRQNEAVTDSVKFEEGFKTGREVGAREQKEQMMKSPLVSVGYMASEELQRINYENGRKDMKEQMMKEAVEGKVDEKTFGYKTIRPDLKQLDTILESLSEGDKVRIVIVKKE